MLRFALQRGRICVVVVLRLCNNRMSSGKPNFTIDKALIREGLLQ